MKKIYVLALLAFAQGAASAGYDGKQIADEKDGRNWLAYGRTYSENHASPLKQITTDNVGRLGLAWSLDLPNVHNGLTVPLAVDGVIYFTVDQSKVHAVDAKTGKLLWRFDPEVWKVAGDKFRLSWGPRGIAYWKDRIYIGTLDGRLIALAAKSGKQLWSVQTVPQDDSSNITGAPRVFNGKVVIGHGGADFGAIRGYATAYDAETGKQLWRWYAVPGDPAKGFEDPSQEMAAKTWTGEWWKLGGGGTIWNAITYDPELNRVYLGTGNGGPHGWKPRSPGGGDNLFLSSIVALDADTGKYVWHYQNDPANDWDYNSTMDITTATLAIDGKPRKVLMQAPKNGFLYVIDPRKRQADLRREDRLRDLGQQHQPGHGPAGGGPGGARGPQGSLAQRHRRAFGDGLGVQPADRLSLHPHDPFGQWRAWPERAAHGFPGSRQHTPAGLGSGGEEGSVVGEDAWFLEWRRHDHQRQPGFPCIGRWPPEGL